MGLLNKMFGGGTEVRLHLPVSRVPVGGTFSGRASVKGGKEDLELVALHVRLLHVDAEAETPHTKPETRILVDQPVATDQRLAAGAELEFSFRLTLPRDAEPSTDDAGYEVMAIAGIRGVKDPSTRVALTVVAASEATASEVAASEAAASEATASDATNSDRGRDTTGTAALADEDALPLVREHVRHPDVTLRRALASALRQTTEDRCPDKKALLLAMAHDGDDEVRFTIFAALGDFREDPHVTRLYVDAIDHDPNPEVKAASIDALCFGHDHELAPTTREIYERHLDSPHPEVRIAIAHHLDGLPREDPSSVAAIVRRLLDDPTPQVRRAVARGLHPLDRWPEPLAEALRAELSPSDLADLADLARAAGDP